MAGKKKADALSRGREAARRPGEEWRTSASGRLDADGASKSAQMQRRLQLVGDGVVYAARSEDWPHHDSSACLLLPDTRYQLRLVALWRSQEFAFDDVGAYRRQATGTTSPENIKSKLARVSESEREVIEMG